MVSGGSAKCKKLLLILSLNVGAFLLEDYYGRHLNSFSEEQTEDTNEHHFYGPLVLPADTEYAADVLLFITTKLTAIRQLKMPPDWWSLLAQMMPALQFDE